MQTCGVVLKPEGEGGTIPQLQHAVSVSDRIFLKEHCLNEHCHLNSV